jgi:Fe-S-cluster-containing hydrogenase component 2
MAAKVDPSLCPQNHPCPAVKICPMEAISQEGNGLPRVDEEACTECGACMDFCPMGAIKLD